MGLPCEPIVPRGDRLLMLLKSWRWLLVRQICSHTELRRSVAWAGELCRHKLPNRFCNDDGCYLWNIFILHKPIFILYLCTMLRPRHMKHCLLCQRLIIFHYIHKNNMEGLYIKSISKNDHVRHFQIASCIGPALQLKL